MSVHDEDEAKRKERLAAAWQATATSQAEVASAATEAARSHETTASAWMSLGDVSEAADEEEAAITALGGAAAALKGEAVALKEVQQHEQRVQEILLRHTQELLQFLDAHFTEIRQAARELKEAVAASGRSVDPDLRQFIVFSAYPALDKALDGYQHKEAGAQPLPLLVDYIARVKAIKATDVRTIYGQHEEVLDRFVPILSDHNGHMGTGPGR